MGSGCWDGTSITWSRTISHTVAVIPTWWTELTPATSSDTILVSIQTTIQTAGYQPSATTATSIRISSPTDRIHVSASTRATLARELIAISCMAARTTWSSFAIISGSCRHSYVVDGINTGHIFGYNFSLDPNDNTNGRLPAVC